MNNGSNQKFFPLQSKAVLNVFIAFRCDCVKWLFGVKLKSVVFHVSQSLGGGQFMFVWLFTSDLVNNSKNLAKCSILTALCVCVCVCVCMHAQV